LAQNPALDCCEADFAGKGEPVFSLHGSPAMR
jgi:hypothetical protein